MVLQQKVGFSVMLSMMAGQWSLPHKNAYLLKNMHDIKYTVLIVLYKVCVGVMYTPFN